MNSNESLKEPGKLPYFLHFGCMVPLKHKENI